MTRFRWAILAFAVYAGAIVLSNWLITHVGIPGPHGTHTTPVGFGLLARIKQGAAIPGWMAQQGQGREKWAMPLPEVIALGQMMGVDISKPGAVTPKQAIKAGLPAELVKQYSETPFGEIKLVPDTVSASRRIFG